MQNVIEAAAFWGKVIANMAMFWALGWLLGFLSSFFIARECREAMTKKERAILASKYGYTTGNVMLALAVISIFVRGKKLPIERP